MSSFSEFKSGFTGSLGDARYPAGINIPAAIEDDGLDAGLDSALANELANQLRSAFLVHFVQLTLQGRIHGACADQGDALRIVNNLNLDVLVAAVYGQSRHFRGAADLFTDPRVTNHANLIPVTLFEHLQSHSLTSCRPCLPCGGYAHPDT